MTKSTREKSAMSLVKNVMNDFLNFRHTGLLGMSFSSCMARFRSLPCSFPLSKTS